MKGTWEINSSSAGDLPQSGLMDSLNGAYNEVSSLQLWLSDSSLVLLLFLSFRWSTEGQERWKGTNWSLTSTIRAPRWRIRLVHRLRCFPRPILDCWCSKFVHLHHHLTLKLHFSYGPLDQKLWCYLHGSSSNFPWSVCISGFVDSSHTLHHMSGVL